MFIRTWWNQSSLSGNLTEASEKFSNFSLENMLILKIMPEEKLECLKDLKRDGIILIPYLVALWLRRNKNIEIISRLTLKKTERMRDLKNSSIDNRCSVMRNTVLDILISNKLTQLAQKMIKLLMLRKRFSSTNTEELWTNQKTMKEETREWLKDKKPDSKKLEFNNFFQIILKTQLSINQNI